MDEVPREIPAEAVLEPKRHSFLVDLFIRLIKEKPLGTVGGVIVLLLVLVAILADILAPYGMNETILIDRMMAPSAEHLMGTDNVGRDLLSRVIYGARVSVYVGLAAAGLATLVATIIGVISGFLGGKVDIAIQRFVDAWMALPALLLYLTIMAILGPGLWQVIIVLGVAQGIRYSRVVRSGVISIKGNVYVEAARAVGVSTGGILTRHILPNMMAAIMVIFTMSMGYMILNEAILSFLGFGVPPPQPSWGAMLSGAGRRYMLQAPWIALWPGLVLAIVIYGINMLGDALRDLLDPRLRGGLGRYSGMKRKIPKLAKPAQKSDGSE